MTDRFVWSLVIEYTGSADRILHDSLHEAPESGCRKAQQILKHDVPDMDEWYERPTDDDRETERWGYVLKRNEIGSWPIRIEMKRSEVLSLTA